MNTDPEPYADTVVMDRDELEVRVTDLLWEEFERYLQDGDVHPHVMRAIAGRIVALLIDGTMSDG